MDDVASAAERLPALPQYPRLFREFVERHSFVAFDVGGVRVFSNLAGEEDSLGDLLADKVLTRELTEAGFPPFGRPTTSSYDRVCFDVRVSPDVEDSPVVLMDHEAIFSKNRIPRPRRLAASLVQLFEVEGQGAEPGASPNGGPATRLGNSGARGGPPSVS